MAHSLMGPAVLPVLSPQNVFLAELFYIFIVLLYDGQRNCEVPSENEQEREGEGDSILEKSSSGIFRRYQYGKTYRIAAYSVLHMLVDGMCALAMFGRFIPKDNGYLSILLYNFCAFALQMPMGVVLDALNADRSARRDHAFAAAVLGVFCTILGAVTYPVVLGIGNALFHIGGGVGVTEADMASAGPSGVLPQDLSPKEPLSGKWYGQGLGIFVAPGALGLYLGTLAAKNGAWEAGLFGVSVLMVLLCAVLWLSGKSGREREAEMIPAGTGCREAMEQKYAKSEILPILFCITVVILRSHIGMTVGFPWKRGMTAGILAVLAVVGGKMAGGFAAAKWGLYKTVVVSLALAACCYLFSAVMPFGLAASFLFNMTMPLTLYWMICRMPGRPGFAFGFLTFALFLGFLPGYFGLVQNFAGNIAGCSGSILSLLLLAAVMGRRDGCGAI